MNDGSQKVGGLLLAAGGSRRLGTPKQLLEFEGKSLIRRAAEALIDAGCYPVVVVLGAETEGSQKELEGFSVEIVENADWESGMSSSIRVGIESLVDLESSLDAVLITLVDQPFVAAEKLALFCEHYFTVHPPIIAARYRDVLGVPALFSKEHFSSLADLTGDKGARDLIRSGPTVAIDLPEAAMDIDKPEDLSQE